MSDEPEDEAADSQQESEQQPVDSDQSSAQSDEQPTEQTDQSTERSEEQPAESEEPADQGEEQPTDSDQGAEQPEEQPTDGDQASKQPEEQPSEGDQPAAEAEEQPSETGQTADQGQPAGSAQPAGQASQPPTQSPAPERPYGVESWRPLVTEMAGDIPVEVLLRWIKRESGGNPCATGAPAKSGGGSIENGIFQLYSPDDDRFATPAQLHGAFCSGQTCIRDLTLEEARIQVASGIAQVNSLRNLARAHLKGAGVVWEEVGSDFWSLVKMEHNVPVVCRDYLKTLRPTSWSEFKAGVLKNPPKQYSGNINGILSLAEDIGTGAT